MKRKTRLLIRDAFLSTILSCILLAILSIVFVNIRFFNPLHKALKDFSFLDVYYAEKFEDNSKINNDIILVNVENHGREVIATLLESVLNEDPKVVGFDIILEKHKSHNHSDSLLAKLLKNKKVVTSFDFNEDDIEDNVIENESFFYNPNESAYVNFDFNEEIAVVREFQGMMDINGEKRLSFATMISKHYLKPKTWKKNKYDTKLENLQVIKYSGNLEKFPILSINDFLFSSSKKILKDKIVILGYLGSSKSDNRFDIRDKHFTPLNNQLAGKSDKDMYGVVVHANIVNMLIKNDLIYRVSYLWQGVITFICMFISTMVYMKLNRNYKISYRTRKQTYQFTFSVVLLLVVFGLLKNDIVLSPFIIIIGILLAGSYFKYYKHLVRYIKTKRKWKTYVK
ncbi:CHASE2 domain-containing protein [Winogradskyella sp. UBA3174]|uniref:CHASE2 domain-containing protein n=1 Tax=Winogradskyella sp. UBA3174 TaxID=1947785 RepID=UPI0025FD58D7|nr:CHASE2 domain-containing protein [Winogradskyella sp. UBA3174]|tara:strand:+ start:6540 stop:7733 length:1194 start_codon:yes stop_codon:yes gene_type:complete